MVIFLFMTLLWNVEGSVWWWSPQFGLTRARRVLQESREGNVSTSAEFWTVLAKPGVERIYLRSDISFVLADAPKEPVSIYNDLRIIGAGVGTLTHLSGESRGSSSGSDSVSAPLACCQTCLSAPCPLPPQPTTCLIRSGCNPM